MHENRAGQPYDATWHKAVVTEDGSKKNYEKEGTKFWCVPTQAQRCSRQFRTNIEGKTISMILGSTNVSKLKGIEEDNDSVVIFENKRYRVSYAEYNMLERKYTVALT